MSTTACTRHPGEETRLSCSNCGDAICHRCAVPTPVGQKCPACARQPRTARARARPRKLLKAAAVGIVAAVALGLGLSLFIRVSGGWFTLIASGFVGYGIARAVHWGAEGNRAGPFRGTAFGLAVGGVEVAWLLLGVLLPVGWGLLSYAAAAYGAWIVYR